MNVSDPQSPSKPQSRADHRRMLVKRWYSLSGIEAVRAQLTQDDTLDEVARDELIKIADRRINEIIDAHLGVTSG